MSSSGDCSTEVCYHGAAANGQGYLILLGSADCTGGAVAAGVSRVLGGLAVAAVSDRFVLLAGRSVD